MSNPINRSRKLTLKIVRQNHILFHNHNNYITLSSVRQKLDTSVISIPE